MSYPENLHIYDDRWMNTDVRGLSVDSMRGTSPSSECRCTTTLCAMPWTCHWPCRPMRASRTTPKWSVLRRFPLLSFLVGLTASRAKQQMSSCAAPGRCSMPAVHVQMDVRHCTTSSYCITAVLIAWGPSAQGEIADTVPFHGSMCRCRARQWSLSALPAESQIPVCCAADVRAAGQLAGGGRGGASPEPHQRRGSGHPVPRPVRSDGGHLTARRRPCCGLGAGALPRLRRGSNLTPDAPTGYGRP